MKKVYDLAFSLGFSCGGTDALRNAGLQFASYPLDWIGAPSVLASAGMIVRRFDGWLQKEDLELFDVRYGKMNRRVFRNRRTGYGFPHDFPVGSTLEEAYPEVARKYARRIDRFLQEFSAAKRVLMIYIDRPINARAADAELVEARRILAEAYPQAEIDLIYFYIDGSEGGFRETPVASGVTAVACDYRKYLGKEISHEVAYRKIAGYLGGVAEVIDRGSEAERTAYSEKHAENKRTRFSAGGSFWTAKLAKIEYRLYRRLERRLIAAGVLPPERPLWFY